MDTVEGTPIVGTVVKWFGGLAKGGRQLEPYGGSGRKHNLSYEKPGITVVRRPCEDGDQWNRWWEVGIESKNATHNRIQMQHNGARKRNITISPIPWVCIEHKRT